MMLLEQYLRDADDQLQAGRVREAEALCFKALTLRPNYPPALHLAGLISLKAGRLDEAIERLRQACADPKVPANYLSNLAEMLRHKGALADAEAFARKAIARNAEFTGGWNNLGIILQERGKLAESVTCFEKILAQEPRNVQALTNLGTTYKRLGRVQEAEAAWKKAHALEPGFATPASNLTTLYTEWGNLDLAVSYGRKAIAGKPVLMDAYLNLAAAESARTNYAGALSLLDKIAQVGAKDARVHAYRAMVLRQTGRMEEALAAADKALALSPNLQDAHFTRGTVLKALGRNDDAMKAFQAARALSAPGDDKAVLAQAVLLGEIGRGDEALAAFDDVIASNPDSVTAYFYRSDYAKSQPGDPMIAAMEKLLAGKSEGQVQDRMSLHFALSKAFLDIDDGAKAFHHMHAGNRLKRATMQYDPVATRDRISAIIAGAPKTAIAAAARDGCPSDVPVFIVGMPRSGTTLVEQILAAHPDVSAAGELRFMSDLAEEWFPQSLKLNDAIRPLRELGQTYLDRIRDFQDGRSRVVDKMPTNFLYAGIIHAALPGAKIIHVRRNKLDTCGSCYSKLFANGQSFTYSPEELSQFYDDYIRLMDHWRSSLPQSALLEIAYEDIVADLSDGAHRLTDFVGLPWNDACLEFYAGNRTVRTASVNQVRRPLYATSIGKWRRYADLLGIADI